MKNQSQGVKGYHKPEIDMPPLPKIRPKKCFHFPCSHVFIVFTEKGNQNRPSALRS